MPRIGIVKELKGKYAIISSSRRGICEGCSDKSSCSFDNALGKSVPEIVTAINQIRAEEGDQVEFDLTGHTELKMSLIVWIVPLIGLILGAVAGSIFHNSFGISNDSGTLIGLVFGLLIAFSGMVIYERLFVTKESTLPVLSKVIQHQSCPGSNTEA